MSRIITTEHLFETQAKETLHRFIGKLIGYVDVESLDADGFDALMWDNFIELGEAFYQVLGEFYPDLEEALNLIRKES